MIAIVLDSIRNCRITSRGRAPSALRIPISRVRSVTDTSMMFIITMPPTISEIDAITIITMKNVPLRSDHSDRKLSLVSITKLSFSPSTSWRRARKITRDWSMACSMGNPTS